MTATTTCCSAASFRVRGDVLEIQPADRETAFRVSLWGDEIERIWEIDTLTGEVLTEHQQRGHLPGQALCHLQGAARGAIEEIEQEMNDQVEVFEAQGKLLEAQRIKQRTSYDHGDAARGGLLQRHRELQPPPGRSARPAARRGRCSTTSLPTGCSSSTRAT